MAAGYVGILSVELHFPEAGSLKGKRKYAGWDDTFTAALIAG